MTFRTTISGTKDHILCGTPYTVTYFHVLSCTCIKCDVLLINCIEFINRTSHFIQVHESSFTDLIYV